MADERNRKPRTRRATWIFLVLGVAAIVGLVVWANWGRIAVLAAPDKQAATTRSQAAVEADKVFWRVFHGGAYEEIPETLEVLTAAYLDTPTDAVTAAHIAWLHNWKVAERVRSPSATPSITDHIVLARRYFAESHRLDPSDARVQGFLAGHLVAEGTVHGDEGLVRRGYYLMLDAIDAWPEFNLFTGGYVMSRLPPDSPRFQEGLEWEWENLDVCIGERFDRENPDYFGRYAQLETKEGPKRVCWNSWIAPHNLEGFFLNMGDMLVKSGDWQTARKIYANAKAVPDYASWPFASVLEARIEQAEENVAAFNSAPGAPKRPIMIESEFACMACHQR
jgi:hypothetical protein